MERAAFTGRVQVLLSVLVGLTGVCPVGADADPPGPDIVLRTSNRNLILFDYQPGEPSLVQDEGGTVSLSLDGAGNLGRAGAPALPVRRVAFGIPHGAEVSVRLVRSPATSLGSHRVKPAPRWEPPTEDARLGRAFYDEDPAVYRQDDAFPREPVRMVLDSVFRGQRIVVLELIPFRYRSLSGDLEFIAPMTVALEIRGGESAGALRAPDLHEGVFRRQLANYEQARAWRKRPAHKELQKAAAGFEQGTEWFKLGITDKGMYRVSGAMLEGAGLNISGVDPEDIRLFWGGGRPLPEDVDYDRLNDTWMTECRIWVRDGSSQGVLDTDDEIIFYGLGAQGWANDYDGRLARDEWWTNAYTDTNVYWLVTGGTFGDPPRRVETRREGWEAADVLERTSSPVWIREEKNRIENFEIYYEDGWMWANFDNATHEQLFPLVVSGLDTNKTATLRVRMCGQRSSGARHEASVSLNGVTLATGSWSSDDALDLVTPASPDDGSNFLGIRVATSDTSAVAEVTLAWLELEYWRRLALGDQVPVRSPDTTAVVEYVADLDGATQALVFDVTDPYAPVHLDSVRVSDESAVFRDLSMSDSSFQYIAVAEFRSPEYLRADEPSDLRTNTAPVDLLVIYHPAFESAVQTFVSHRQSGWQVRAVSVYDVYDEFSWGLFDPVAIRDFLAYASANYGAAGKSGPGYALLFGDASYNYRAEGSLTIPNYVPSWHGRYRRGADNIYSTDDWYGYLDPDDELMDVAVGRFPVQSLEEAEAIVDKVVAYDGTPDFGPWRTRAIIAADDLGKQCLFNPCEVVHTQDAENLAEGVLPDVLNREKIYLVDYEYVACLKREAQEDLRASINEGALITLFIGHGDRAKLADEELYVWRSSRPPENTGRPTFFLAGSCDVADFAQPTGSSLGENLLRQPESGAVAVFSSTYLAYSVFNYRLLRAMFSSLFPDGQIADRPVGEALLEGKNEVRQSGQEVGRPYHNERLELLGDPTLKLASPRLHVSITGAGAGTVEFVRRDTVAVRGTVLEEGVPASLFNGTAWVEVFGSADTTGHDVVNHLGQPLHNCSTSHLEYTLLGLPIFRGQTAVENGEFEARFIVPWDASEGRLARISAYVSNGDTDGVGVLDSIGVGGMADSDDASGPAFSVFKEGSPVTDGSSLPPEGTLVCCFEDPSGINIQGTSDTSAVLLIVDSSEFVELTERCEYETGSYTKACAQYAYSLEDGPHTLEVRAMDNMGNRSQQVFNVEVGQEGRLRISNVFPYPNPFEDGTYLIYDLSRDADVTVRIFTVAGHPVRKIEAGFQTSGQQSVYWDGRDEEMDEVANGAYLFRVDARSGGGSANALGKAMRVR